MIRKKIFLLGAFAVGKTSLVAQFVHSIFSERYLTTVGVRIEKKSVVVAGREITLLIWDLHGEDEFQKVKSSYLRGSSGYFLVADGTRRETVRGVLDLHDWAASVVGDLPCTLLLNKADLENDWVVEEEDFARFKQRGLATRTTSAKTGEGVEDAFTDLSMRMIRDMDGAEQERQEPASPDERVERE